MSVMAPLDPSLDAGRASGEQTEAAAEQSQQQEVAESVALSPCTCCLKTHEDLFCLTLDVFVSVVLFDTMNQHVLTISSTGSSNYRDHMQLLVTSVGDECRDLVRPSS